LQALHKHRFLFPPVPESIAMALLNILRYPDPRLHTVAKPVAEVDARIRRLIDDMLETMYAAKGIGLAAPQVGRLERIAVIDVDDNPMAIVNPEILRREGTVKGEEGCLSIPEVYGDVERAARVVVRALDRDGRAFEIEASELLARCLQHEIDHLHGKLFLDYLSVLKRRSALAKWEKERKQFGSNIRKLSAGEIAGLNPGGEL
jgi:peptide deformylase